MKSYNLTKIILIIVGGLFRFSSPEKILFYFGGGSYSHKHSVWPWTVGLAEAGHSVTFLSSHPKRPWENEGVRDLVSPTLHSLMTRSYDLDRFEERERGEEQNILWSYSKVTTELCEVTLLGSKGDRILQGLLHNETFDLVVVNVIFGECGFIFANHYGAKVIAYDASVTVPWFYDVHNLVAETSWVPNIMYSKYSTIPLSFPERVMNSLWAAYWHFDRALWMYPAFDKIIAEAFPLSSRQSFAEMERNVSLILVNSHHSFDFPVSIPPLIVQMGGINAWLPEKSIPEEYLSFMNGAGDEGVVLISFGSTVKLEKVKSRYSNIFLSLVQALPDVRFLLKWAGPLPKPFRKLGNLLASDWLPQRELLRHPKMRAFITHGGLNSIQEATYYGVPLLVIPLFADQDYNAYRVEAQGVGLRMEITSLTLPTLHQAMSAILSNPGFKEKMTMKSRMFRDRPVPPLALCLHSTNFVLNNSDFSSLRPSSHHGHLTFLSRRLLDVHAFLVILLIAVIKTIHFLWKWKTGGSSKRAGVKAKGGKKQKTN